MDNDKIEFTCSICLAPYIVHNHDSIKYTLNCKYIPCLGYISFSLKDECLSYHLPIQNYLLKSNGKYTELRVLGDGYHYIFGKILLQIDFVPIYSNKEAEDLLQKLKELLFFA